MTEWWTAAQGGLVGGIGGSFVGLMGAAIGVIAGVYARRGMFKGLAFALHGIGVALGLVMAVAGIAALLDGQPYHVFYPLLLLGLMSAGLFGGLFFVTKSRYQQAENAHFEAEQIRRA